MVTGRRPERPQLRRALLGPAEGFPTLRWAGMRTASDYPVYHLPNDTFEQCAPPPAGAATSCCYASLYTRAALSARGLSQASARVGGVPARRAGLSRQSSLVVGLSDKGPGGAPAEVGSGITGAGSARAAPTAVTGTYDPEEIRGKQGGGDRHRRR